MSDKPKCFSYVNSNNDYLEKIDVTRVTDCKACELLEACVAAYNDRVYNEWVADYYDQDQFERDMKWGEMMDEQEQRELENPDPMLDDYRGLQ